MASHLKASDRYLNRAAIRVLRRLCASPGAIVDNDDFIVIANVGTASALDVRNLMLAKNWAEIAPLRSSPHSWVMRATPRGVAKLQNYVASGGK